MWLFNFYYACATCKWPVPVEDRRGCHVSSTGVTDGHGLLCGCCGLNWGPWEEPSVFLTDELALQPKFLLNIVSHLALSSAKLMRTVSSFSEVINAVVPLNGDVRAGHSRECQSVVFFL